MEFQSAFTLGTSNSLNPISSHGALSSEDSTPGATVTWCSEALFSGLRKTGRKVDSWMEKERQSGLETMGLIFQVESNIRGETDGPGRK